VIGTIAAGYPLDKTQQVKDLRAAGADLIISDMVDLPKAVEWLDNGCDAALKPDFAAEVYLPSAPSAPGRSATPGLRHG
jgi:hypothetical protein